MQLPQYPNQNDRPPSEILVLEDEPVLAKNTVVYLSRLGYEVHLAGSVLEALPILRRKKIDLIYLGINLPDTSGLEFYGHIKRQFSQMQIVVMRGKKTSLQKQRARELNISTFLVKPFALASLNVHVAKLGADCQGKSAK